MLERDLEITSAYLLLQLQQTGVDISTLVSSLGFPVFVALLFAWFFLRYVWPWMTGTMDRYVEENRQHMLQYKELVENIREDNRLRDSELKTEFSRIEQAYKELVKSHGDQNIRMVEALSSNAIAMQALSEAVDRMRQAAALEERVQKLENRSPSG